MRNRFFARALMASGILAAITFEAQPRDLFNAPDWAEIDEDLVQLAGDGTGGNGGTGGTGTGGTTEGPIDPTGRAAPAAAVRADASPSAADFGRLINWLRSAKKKPLPPPGGPDPGTGPDTGREVERVAKQLEDYKAFKEMNPSSAVLAPLPALPAAASTPLAKANGGGTGGGTTGGGGTGGNTEPKNSDVTETSTRLQKWMSANPLPQDTDSGTGSSTR